MGFPGEYKCSNCGKQETKELLTAKKVMFQELGVKPRSLRSRIVSWLCPACVAKDPDWKREAYNSPGMVTPPNQRTNATQATARYQAIEEHEDAAS